MSNINQITKQLKHCLKQKVKLTKALVITLLITGGFAMADSPSVPEVVKYTPVVDGTVTGVDGTSIGNGALTTSTSGISTGRGNIASGGGISADELKRKLAENKSLRDDINSVSNEITNKKKEIADKSAEILKLENANREAIANVDRVAGARRRVEELNRELEGKRGEKATKVEELRELEVRYTEEIKKLNKKKEILNSLAINWTNEDLSDEGKWMPRVEEWARELKNAIDPDGTLGNKITEEETINEDEFYKDYVTNYIKSYVVVPDLKSLVTNGDLKNIDKTITNANWNIKNNSILKSAGINDGTITKLENIILRGYSMYYKKDMVTRQSGDNNDEIGGNFIYGDTMNKYNLSVTKSPYRNTVAENTPIRASESYSYIGNEGSGKLRSFHVSFNKAVRNYNEYVKERNEYITLSSLMFRKLEDLEKWEKYEMENTSSIFTKKDHTITKENVVNFYEDYKAARNIELTKINAELDKLEEKGLLKPVEKEYKKYRWEKIYEEMVLYDTIRAFNTVLQKLDKDSLEAVRITNEKKKILEMHKNKWTSDETYNKEIKLWNDVKEFTNSTNEETLTLDKVKNPNNWYKVEISGLKWYDENIIDVQNRNDKNTKKFIKAFSDEIERLKALERDAKEVINRYDTEIAGIEGSIRKTTPDRTDEEAQRDANEKLTALNDAKAKLEEKKQELAEKEKELKEKINTLRENLNIDGGTETIAHGINNIVSGDKGIALGNSNAVSGEGSVATGLNNTISGRNSFAYGAGHNITGDNSGAFGDPITIHGDGSYGFGNNITIGTQGDKQVGKDTFVLGSDVNTNVNNAVILGKGSIGVENAVSVGSENNTRNIKFVKEGEISATSKDAVNGSQLFGLADGSSDNINVAGWRNKLGITNNVGGGTPTNITIKSGLAEKALTDGNKLQFLGGNGIIATLEGEDNSPTVKYEVNVDNTTIEIDNSSRVALKDGAVSKRKLDEELKGKIDAIDTKLDKNLANFNGDNVDETGKTRLITVLNKDVNLTTPTGALVKDSDIKPELDKKLNSADVTKEYLTTKLGKGSVTSTELTINNGTDRLVGDGDLTISLKDNSISEGKLDQALRDKLARIGQANPGVAPVLTKGSLAGDEFEITGDGKLVDGGLTIALKDGAISKDKLNEELKGKIEAIDAKADKAEVDKKLNKDLSNFDDNNVDETGKTKLITALNKNFNIETPTGAVATDRDLKALGDNKANKNLDNVTEVADGAKTVLINALSDGADVNVPTGKLVTDTIVKQGLDGKANTDLNNIVTIGDNGKSKLKEALGGADLDAPKDAFVTDTILKPVLETFAKKDASNIEGADLTAWRTKLNEGVSLTTPTGALVKDSDIKPELDKKLNKDADNLSETGVTNLINKLTANANLNNPVGKLVTDAMIKPALDLKLNKSDLVKANLVGNGITVEGTGKVLDSNLTLSITDGAITKEKLAEPLKKEIDSKVSKEVMALALVSKANVDASNVDGENITKWREKLGITDNGEVIANPNSVNYTDDTHSVVNLGKDNIPVSIRNVALPINDLDATNKIYVDNKVKEATYGVQSMINNSIAMGQIPQVAANKYFSFGAGAAYNGGKVGSFAFGISGQDKTQRFIYKATAGLSTDLKWNIGAGFNISLGEIPTASEQKDEQVIIDNSDKIKASEDKLNKILSENNAKLVKENDKLKDVINNLADKLAKLEKEIKGNSSKVKENDTKVKENDTKVKENDTKVKENITVSNLGETVRLFGFNTDVYNLSKEQKAELDSLAKVLVGKEVVIIGYADIRATEKYNLELGLNRAKAVREYLMNKGITVKEIQSMGHNRLLEGSLSDNRVVEIKY